VALDHLLKRAMYDGEKEDNRFAMKADPEFYTTGPSAFPRRYL